MIMPLPFKNPFAADYFFYEKAVYFNFDMPVLWRNSDQNTV